MWTMGCRAWLICLLAGMVGAAEPVRPLTLATGDYPPYIGEHLSRHGILSAVVVTAFSHAGIPVQYVATPNNRAMSGMRVGIYDGSYGWAKSPEREQFLYFSDPVMSLNMVFCHRRDRSFPWQSLADLSPWLIGVTAGNFYSDAFQTLVDRGGLKVDQANSDVDNLHKLAAGHIDLFPIGAETGPYLIQTALSSEERKQLVCDTRAYWSVPMHVVLSRKLADAPQLIERLNATLAAMRKSGEMDRLIDESRREISGQPVNSGEK